MLNPGLDQSIASKLFFPPRNAARAHTVPTKPSSITPSVVMISSGPRFSCVKHAQGYFGENSLVCPNYDCSRSFSAEELHEILEPKTREHIENLRLLAAVNRDPKRCWCPNHECGAPVDLRRTMATKRTAKCGKCERKFCPRCGEAPHRGSCPRDQTYVEWVKSTERREDEDGVQECPKCHHHIEKRGA